MKIAALPAGTYPSWSVDTQYKAGDDVLYQGLPYRAKWSHQGVSPATQSTDLSGSPWEALTASPASRAARRPVGAVSGSSPSPSASPSASPMSPETETP